MRWTLVLLSAAATGFILSGAASGPQQPDRPHIILVMADDQGWGDMAYNGHPHLKTPHFDEAAAAGLRFDRFYAAAPVCTPTRAAVMTGRHPNRMGAFSWGHTLRPQEVTAAEALKTAGYVTGHFGKWHLGPARLGTPTNPGASGFDAWVSAPNFFDNDPILSRQGQAEQMVGESSMVTVHRAIDFIRAHASGPDPMFVVVWFGSPHLPHRAAEEDRALYADAHPERLQHFYGEITGMDRAFGKLRRELDALGIRENTLLWYTSDNGGLPEVGATGGRGDKGDIYEGGLRVPAFLEWPARLTEPRATAVPAVSQDIYPTLLEIAGVALPHQPPLDGMSLLPLIEGSLDRRPSPIGFWSYPAPGVPTPSAELMSALLQEQQAGSTLGDPAHLRLDAWVQTEPVPTDYYAGHAAWLDWPFKLHRVEPDGAPGEVRFELYDLSVDSMETRDLSVTMPERIASMRRSLELWQTSVLLSLNGLDYR